MKAHTLWIAVLGSLALGASAGVVRADVPPPSGYTESCTIQKKCSVGKACVLCPADFHDEIAAVSACSRGLADQGYVKECKAWGASVWDEVWCRPAAGALDASIMLIANDGGVDHQLEVVVCKESSSGCGSCGVPGASSRRELPGTLAVVSWITLAILRSRRRRSAAR